MARPPPDPALVARIRLAVVLVLVPLALVSVTVALMGWWPVPMIDALTVEWLGVTSWRARITGVFVVFGGGFLLPALLVALAGVTVFRAMRPAR